MKLDKPLFMLNRDLSRNWKKVNEWKLPIHSYDLNFPEATFNRHVGIEIEVERCGSAAYPDLFYWAIDRDGSLRGDDAREFKLNFPSTVQDAYYALDEFMELVAARRGTRHPELFEFSERTSIHVHIDVRDLTEMEIKSATKLYMIFERSFFDLVGRDRRHNIFCIPVSESSAVGAFVPARQWWGNWEKYCALNLATLSNFGTMEFRSMAGNENIQLIKGWVLLLASLVEYAHQVDPEEIDTIINTLKTESQYHQLAVRIFGQNLASVLTMFPEASDSAASLTKLL